MQFEVLPANSTYNTATNMPDPQPAVNGTDGAGHRRVKRSSEVKRVLSRRGAFVPPGKRRSVGRRMGMMPWPRK